MATIAIGSDHAGPEAKSHIKDMLESIGETVIDCGTQGPHSVDYPDYAQKVGQLIQTGAADWGVLICGTGIGISIAANKMKGIRAALCHNPMTAQMARAHNNANVLCLGARVLEPATMLELVRVFRETTFEGGRHQNRIDKIHQLEE